MKQNYIKNKFSEFFQLKNINNKNLCFYVYKNTKSSIETDHKIKFYAIKLLKIILKLKMVNN